VNSPVLGIPDIGGTANLVVNGTNRLWVFIGVSRHAARYEWRPAAARRLFVRADHGPRCAGCMGALQSLFDRGAYSSHLPKASHIDQTELPLFKRVVFRAASNPAQLVRRGPHSARI